MTITWITIHVEDFEASKSFFRDFLGLKAAREFAPSPAMSIAFFIDDKGMEIELIHEDAVKPPPPGNGGVSIGMRAGKYDDLLRQARERGILAGEPAVLGPDVECFFVRGPGGVGVQIIRQR